MAHEAFSVWKAVFHTMIVAYRRPAAFLWLILSSAGIVTAIVIAAGLLSPEASGPTLATPASRQAAQFWLNVTPLIVGGLALLIFCTACLRLLLGQRLPGGIPFRLGSSEGRVFASSFAFLFLVIAVLAAPTLVVAVVQGYQQGYQAGLTGESHSGPAGSPSAGFVLAVMAMLGVYLYLSVRYLPALALSLLERRIVTFSAWEATRGVYWLALISVVLSGLLYGGAEYFLNHALERVPLPQTIIDMPHGKLAFEAALKTPLFGLIMALQLGPYAYMALRRYREMGGAPVTDAPAESAVTRAPAVLSAP